MENFDYQIIANLMAGKGEAEKKLVEIKKFLYDNKKTFRSLEINKPIPISQIPEDGKTHIKEGIICIGGDGTVSETVGYVLNNKIEVPIVIIPTGTANIISKTIGVNSGNSSYEYIIKSKIKEIDIGKVAYQNEVKYFLLGIGIGFEEKFLKLAKEKYKSKIGVLSYFFAAFAELLSLESIQIKIENPEKQINTKVCLLTILNIHPIVFRFFPLFKDETIKEDDGNLNLYFVKYKNYFQAYLGTIAFHILGKHNFGLVKRFTGKEFYIESPVLVATQVDGELRGPLPIKISIHPQKGRFLVS